MEITADNLEQQMEHAETLIDGLRDTVSGTEVFGLTTAQHYLHGVLYAQGSASLNVAGNEGIVDNIKKGLMTVWEAIKNALKKIWDFLFGKERVEFKIKTVKKQAQEPLKEPDQEVKADPEKREAFAKSIEALAEKFSDFNDKYGGIYKEEGGIELLFSAVNISNYPSDLNVIADTVRKGTMLSHVKQINGHIVKVLNLIENNFASVKEHCKKCEKALEEVKGKISAFKENSDGVTKEGLESRLKDLKVMISYANNLAKLEDATLEKLQQLVEDNSRLFGIK